MLLRPMALADREQVVAIELESPSPWAMAQISDELQYAGSVSLVAEDGAGEIYGWCCARSVADEAELLKIAVRSDLRRRSVAARLLCSLEDILMRSSVRELFLEVRSQNVPALHFYRKHGFGEVGRRIGYYSDPAEDALILKKQL